MHFSLERLRNLAGGDEEFVHELLQDFLNDTTSSRDGLIAALEKEDAATARRSVHSIKGLAASAGADELSELAKQAEDAAAEGDLGRVREMLGPLQQELQLVQQDVRQVLDGG